MGTALYLLKGLVSDAGLVFSSLYITISIYTMRKGPRTQARISRRKAGVGRWGEARAGR